MFPRALTFENCSKANQVGLFCHYSRALLGQLTFEMFLEDGVVAQCFDVEFDPAELSFKDFRSKV